MAEIGPIAAKRLARLRRDFLSMSPEEAQDFAENVIRQRRIRPTPLKKVKATKPSKGKSHAENTEPPPQDQERQEDEAPSV
ncbi:MAG: hypothetical protein KGL39_51290 [Patescibacteria group bacterium]|nr:hypothetical protein [Patescibacteria group bacterium]